ncbi:MAG: MerR family transcriptional regulator [Desulfobacteraceae bacterium]|nr:MerR family transcriptional regulator [Desulfobacteraceae bacterium]
MVITTSNFIKLPDKLYFRIGEVSRIAGVPSSVLRFWENEFPLIKPQRTDSGQRLYRKIDVETVLTVKQLLYEKKYTIKGARQFLKKQNTTEKLNSGAAILNEIRMELTNIRQLLE